MGAGRRTSTAHAPVTDREGAQPAHCRAPPPGPIAGLLPLPSEHVRAGQRHEGGRPDPAGSPGFVLRVRVRHRQQRPGGPSLSSARTSPAKPCRSPGGEDTCAHVSGTPGWGELACATLQRTSKRLRVNSHLGSLARKPSAEGISRHRW